MNNATQLGVTDDQRTKFQEAISTGGIAGLGKAGFGKIIPAVKKLLE